MEGNTHGKTNNEFKIINKPKPSKPRNPKSNTFNLRPLDPNSENISLNPRLTLIAQPLSLDQKFKHSDFSREFVQLRGNVTRDGNLNQELRSRNHVQLTYILMS